MKYLFLIIVLGVTLSFAQVSTKSKKIPIIYSDTEKLILYDIHKKNSTTATILSLCFPGAGHIYAANTEKALGFVFIKAALFGTTQYAFLETENLDVLFIGYASILAMTLRELIDVSAEVDKYNEDLFKKLTGKNVSISLNGGSKGYNIQLSYSF